MKKVLVLVAVLALVGAASAEIQLFWSTTGLSNGALQYSTALTNFLPIVAPTPVTTVDASGGPTTVDLYLWGRFVDMGDYNQIYGLDLLFGGDATVGSNVAYRHLNPPPPPNWLRWDGAAGIPLDGVMAAVTAAGIQNYTAGDPANGDLYLAGTREFLLGSAQITGVAGNTKVMSLDLSPDTGLGIAVREYAGGPDIPDPTVIPATLTFVPEPASILLALAGLLIRRR
jgi:hypothetical protein